MTMARPGTGVALFEAAALHCPGQEARLSFTLRPGLNLTRGRPARVLSELLLDAAEDEDRARVLADYALPAALEEATLAVTIDLGD